jgi:threonine/homoserine/homoserine lactone efflux protein
MMVYLVQGLTLGFSAAVSPGPFQAFLLSQTLKSGWQRSLMLALAPLVTDGPIIALVLLVLTQIPDRFVSLLQVAGGLLLLYLAKGAFDVFRKSREVRPGVAAPSESSFLKALAMNGLNPNPYIFWSTVGGPTLIRGWAESPGHNIGFLLGFYLTLIGGLAGYIVLFATASRIDPRLTRLLNGVSALALLIFGLYQIWRGAFGA